MIQADVVREPACTSVRGTIEVDVRDAIAERNSEKAKQAETQREADAERREREEKCAMYQSRMTRFVQNRRIYREDMNGQRQYLSEDEMAEVREKTRAKVEEYCGY